MKKTIALVLTLVMALGMFVGVANAEDVAAVVANIGSEPETLDPHLNSASDGSNYIKHLFEGLMKYAWDGTGITYGSAESYETSEDGLTWTFKIRDDAKWSDGKDLTAADYEYSFKRLVDPAVAAPYAGDMGKFVKNGLAIVEEKMGVEELGVKAIDDKTLEVQLEGPCAFFEEIMAFPTYYPVRQDIVEANGEAWMTTPETLIGNGAYIMESWSHDEEIVMVPSATYYDADKVICKKIVWKLISEPGAKLAAVRSGELHWADDMPMEEIESIKAEGLYNIEPQLGTYYVNINNTKAPFDNVLVRKAFALAIDPFYMAENVTMGVFLPATNFVGGGFLNPDGTQFTDTQVVIDRSDYEANKKAAHEALAEAGYPNGEGFPTVEYATNVTGIHVGTAEAMAYAWKEVLGVNVTIQQMEWNVFLAARRNLEHQLARDGWVADYNDASNLLDLFTSWSGNNSSGYSNASFDEIMLKVQASTDMAERSQLMHDAEMLAFNQEYACIPVYYYATYFLASPKINNVVTYPTGEKFFFGATIDE